jgi:chromate reductase, NAD(P)H dehydrogenase (quinone)
MNILAFGGSNSKHSINKQLATYASTLFDGADVQILDLNDYEMPIFSVDKEDTENYPTKAVDFVKKIGAADLLIISLSEHNGSYSSSFKNIFDWASRIESKTFQDKPVILMAASPGPRGGISVLEAAKIRFPFHGAKILGTFSLPEFGKNFDAELGITNPDLMEKFQTLIESAKTEMSLI